MDIYRCEQTSCPSPIVLIADEERDQTATLAELDQKSALHNERYHPLVTLDV